MIDYKKIINIKNMKDLKKYSLNKPIFQNNYLFHYLILLNNINGLKLTKFPIQIENIDGLNGFHLAAKENHLDILYYLIDTYPDYINNKDRNNNTFTYYLEFTNFYDLIIKYPKLDWEYLISELTINLVISNLKYKDLKDFLSIYKLPIEQKKQYLFSILANNELKIENKIKILDTFSDDEINIKDINGFGLLYYAIQYDDEKLFDYLLTRNIDIYYNDYDNILNNAIFYDIKNNIKKYTPKIINRLIKINDNFMNESNHLQNNIAHNILYLRINTNNDKPDYSIDLDILKYGNSDCWNQLDNMKKSPLELLTKLNYDIYSKLINNISISADIIKKIEEQEIDKRWIKLYKLQSEYKYNNDIIIDKYPYSHNSSWDCMLVFESLYNFYIIDNYDIEFPINESFLLKNISYDYTFPFDKIVQNQAIFPWKIYYFSEDEYYIHQYVNNIINSYKKRFLFITITIVKYNNNNYSYHLNILIFDNKNKIVERFEPHGSINDNDTMDDILEEELTWNTGFKYIRPKEYMQHLSFQAISDEGNEKNVKYGDPGGYCGAWCYWYLETKLKNPDIDSKTLVHKLVNKLNHQDIKFSEYIRNYANKLTIEKNKYLEIIGIDPKNISNVNISNEDFHKIINYIIEKYKTMN